MNRGTGHQNFLIYDTGLDCIPWKLVWNRKKYRKDSSSITSRKKIEIIRWEKEKETLFEGRVLRRRFKTGNGSGSYIAFWCKAALWVRWEALHHLVVRILNNYKLKNTWIFSHLKPYMQVLITSEQKPRPILDHMTAGFGFLSFWSVRSECFQWQFLKVLLVKTLLLLILFGPERELSLKHK